MAKEVIYGYAIRLSHDRAVNPWGGGEGTSVSRPCLIQRRREGEKKDKKRGGYPIIGCFNQPINFGIRNIRLQYCISKAVTFKRKSVALAIITDPWKIAATRRTHRFGAPSTMDHLPITKILAQTVHVESVRVGGLGGRRGLMNP